MTRGMLREAGLTRGEIDEEIARGVWTRVGMRTVLIGSSAALPPRAGRRSGGGIGADATDLPLDAALWTAVWEMGNRGCLDGEAALIAHGLQRWQLNIIDVSLPRNARRREVAGVRSHVLRDVGPRAAAGIPRTAPEVALVRAAQWAPSPASAATVVAAAVQQRVVSPRRLLLRRDEVLTQPRWSQIAGVIGDVCDGAHSLDEIDIARACRERGLAVPNRQEKRVLPGGVAYLDLYWEEERVHVEVDGSQHRSGLAPVRDSMRSNDLAIDTAGLITLRIPNVGWRLERERYLDQIARALAEGRRRQGLA